MHHFPYRHAGDQRRLPFGGKGADHVQVTLGGILEVRHRRFRPDDQVGRFRREGHVPVQGQLCIQVLWVPFQALLDVALNGRHLQRGAGRAGPGMPFEGQAGNPGREQQHHANGEEALA
ncbi:hypothetical protein D3C81_1637630 [compost metagenome]